MGLAAFLGGGGVGTCVGIGSDGYALDDQPISSGFMKSEYAVGQRITILSRRNLWRWLLIGCAVQCR